jgi:hypothetical protein
MRKKINF